MLHRSLALMALLLTALTGCTTSSTHAKDASADSALAAYERPGFVVKMDDGRLWVFQEDAKELAQYEAHGELAKHIVRPAAGPDRLTLKAPDVETANLYMLSKPGFVVKMEDGRLWVFEEGAKELAQFEKSGELAKHVVRPGAGPNRMTIKAPDTETIDQYMLGKPGFVVKVEDGRLWVFQEGSKELAQHEAHGELAKHVVRPGAGPNRMTIKAPDTETIDQYMLGKPGFVIKVEDGRLWVFKQGAKELAQHEAHGELAKHVVRPAAGPNRMTIKAPDTETIDAYLRAGN